jgi:hypothetical protein
MDHPLAGRLILIVDDEPLIAMDIASTFEKAGAKVKEQPPFGTPWLWWRKMAYPPPCSTMF